jgi:dTDP-4-amino-4,6-dideoxygalactose transaminase
VHLQPYYRDLGFTQGQFADAEAYGDSALTLPLYAALTDGDQNRVVTSVIDVLTKL